MNVLDSPTISPKAALLVFAGGTLGTAARMTLVVPQDTVWATIGTAVVNLLGAFALGYLNGAMMRRPATARQRSTRLFLGTGMLGGFTTYSAFAVQAASGWWLLMGVLTVVVGVAVAWGGLLLGKRGVR